MLANGAPGYRPQLTSGTWRVILGEQRGSRINFPATIRQVTPREGFDTERATRLACVGEQNTWRGDVLIPRRKEDYLATVAPNWTAH
jgi:hypothetical protein